MPKKYKKKSLWSIKWNSNFHKMSIRWEESSVNHDDQDEENDNHDDKNYISGEMGNLNFILSSNKQIFLWKLKALFF